MKYLTLLACVAAILLVIWGFNARAHYAEPGIGYVMYALGLIMGAIFLGRIVYPKS